MQTKCKRCHRTDQPLLTNGLCDRCDNVMYGHKPGDYLRQPKSPPYIWVSDPYSKQVKP
jgi:hypothetical protein